MNIHDVVQGSHEWGALRASCFTASEAPAMAGVSKYQSRSDLLKMKYTGEVPDLTITRAAANSCFLGMFSLISLTITRAAAN